MSEKRANNPYGLKKLSKSKEDAKRDISRIISIHHFKERFHQKNAASRFAATLLSVPLILMPISKFAPTASACGTPKEDFSASPNNAFSPETVTIQEFKKSVKFLIITIIIAFSISQSAFGMSGTWPRYIRTYIANGISGPNAKFTIISHSTDRQNFLSLKLDINSAHQECKGPMLLGSEIGEIP